MTNTTTNATKAPLGVGALISESFSVLGKNFVPVMLLAGIPALLGLVVSGAFIGWNVTLGTGEISNDQLANPQQLFAGAMIAFLIQMVVYGLAVALLVQLAYAAKLGRAINIGAYIGPAFAAAPAIVVLSIVAAILFAIGLLALIIPGLWLYAVFFVMAPAVAIERVGFSGLGRSAQLTKEYRWPIVGLLLLLGLILGVMSFIAQALTGLFGGGFAPALVVQIIISAFTSGISAIAVALTYARLREIKEGVSVDDIVGVFE